MLSNPTARNFVPVKTHETFLQMPVRKLFCNKLILAILLVCLISPAAVAQLYPGDANNDGRVNNIDILYIGYAYGSYGPIRPSANVDFSAAAVPLFWTQLFPDSTNFAHADTDGSGRIDFADFLTVYSNYGGKRVNPQPPLFRVGSPGFDPQLRLGAIPNNRLLGEGDSLSIPIYLEAPNGNTLENINGLAFSLELDPRFFKDVFIEFDPSWLKPDSNLFQFQIPTSNRIEVALTRFGTRPVSGRGQIGRLRAVIEDDLIGLLVRDSVSTLIEAKFIKLVDGAFRDLAVAGSQSSIMIYDEDSLVDSDEVPLQSQIQVFPNPSSGILQIQSSPAMQRVEIYNELGQRLAFWQLQNAYLLGITLPNLPRGLILLRIYTEQGILVKKILIKN